MKLKYAVYWIGQERKIYSDDSYYVLGELFGVFNTKKEALKEVERISNEQNILTILPIY